MATFTAYLIKLLLIHYLFCIEISYSQSCKKKERVIRQPLLDTKMEVAAAVTVTASSELNCIHRCYQVKDCGDINMKVESKGSVVCEILAYRPSTGSKKIKRKKGWKYYNMKVLLSLMAFSLMIFTLLSSFLCCFKQ